MLISSPTNPLHFVLHFPTAFLIHTSTKEFRRNDIIVCWLPTADLQCYSFIPNGTTARGGPRPPSRVSSILPDLGRLLFSFYTLALLHLPSLHLPSATWVSPWGAFLLAHWGGLSWINHAHPGVWYVLPILICSICRISHCHFHHTIDRVLGEF